MHKNFILLFYLKDFLQWWHKEDAPRTLGSLFIQQLLSVSSYPWHCPMCLSNCSRPEIWTLTCLPGILFPLGLWISISVFPEIRTEGKESRLSVKYMWLFPQLLKQHSLQKSVIIPHVLALCSLLQRLASFHLDGLMMLQDERLFFTCSVSNSKQSWHLKCLPPWGKVRWDSSFQRRVAKISNEFHITGKETNWWKGS